MGIKEVIKKFGFWIVVGVFWIAVAFTVIGSVFSMFFKTSDNSQDDYEEYFQNNLP